MLSLFQDVSWKEHMSFSFSYTGQLRGWESVAFIIDNRCSFLGFLLTKKGRRAVGS